MENHSIIYIILASVIILICAKAFYKAICNGNIAHALLCVLIILVFGYNVYNDIYRAQLKAQIAKNKKITEELFKNLNNPNHIINYRIYFEQLTRQKLKKNKPPTRI